MEREIEILVVDDDRGVREGLRLTLQGEGYAVRTARDGVDALAKIAERRPNLVLLDVMMPRMNGFRCCEELRRQDGLLPVIFLTGKQDEADQIRGIGLGGDDYVSKSSGEALLLACIRRALERAEQFERKTVECEDATICLGTVMIDTRELTVKEDGQVIERLTQTEVDILRFLNLHRGEMVKSDDIISDLRGNGYACEDSMIYTHMSRLRRKLGKAGDMIGRSRGHHYRLER